MSKTKVSLLVVLTVAVPASAEQPPYQRLLQGEDAKKAPALQKQIDELWAAGKFAEAVAPAEQLLALRQRVQGKDHWESSDATRSLETLRKAAALPAEKQAALAKAPRMNANAGELQSRGKYAEAAPLYRQALAIYEVALGPKHPYTALCYNYLAVSLDDQGRAKEAEPLLRQALAIREEVLGPKHPDTARSYNNLAYNLQDQGRAKEAEPLFRKTLAVWEAVLGPKHPDTATSYNNLASDLDALGRYQEAEPLYRQALAVWEEVLGAKHPLTAHSYNNLATNLDVQGRAKEAEPLCRQALAVFEEVLGAKHPSTAQSYNNLATNLETLGRYKEAEPLLRHALAVREAVLGPKHPDTATSYNNLARNLDFQGRAKEAEPLLRQALAVWEEVLGPKHPGTARSYNNLAGNLDMQGRYQEAEPLHRKALAVWEAVLGPKHPHTALSCNNLATNLDTQGRAKEAEPLHRKALAVREAVLGPKHPDTATSYQNLAYNLQAQGRAEEAEPLWRAGVEAVEAARLRLASGALDRAAAVHIQPHLGLAACRARLGRPLEAWTAAEAGLARGLLDDLAAQAALPPDSDTDSRRRQRAARLQTLDHLLLPLLSAATLDPASRGRRDELFKERADLDNEAAQEAATLSRQAVLPLEGIQQWLPKDAALVFWMDLTKSKDHWGCVLRRSGPPAWAQLPGSGSADAWTDDDTRLARRVHEDLAHHEPEAPSHTRRLAAQRLEPLTPHLAATVDLPAVQRLIVVPVGVMAGVPVEALTDQYLVSYAPSGSVFARLRDKHRQLESPTLLALGDPNFRLPGSGPRPDPPDQGLYLALVLPDGNAAHAGLLAGDILLEYADKRLTTKADLQLVEAGDPVAVSLWRDGQTLRKRLQTGKLGVVLSEDSPAVALRKHREMVRLADVRTRTGIEPLPGTRLEVAAIAALLPPEQNTLLLGSQASEQQLDALAGTGKLGRYSLLHLATHGSVDPISAAHSALELARDQLPRPEEQARRAAAGQKVYTGQLSVANIARSWQLDADLVALSACQTGLGPDGGGEGLLGFSQVLLGKGARSLLLSLWKVDDTATALLMKRFYQNLLAKREGLSDPLPKAEALREAKAWLRGLSRAEVDKLAKRLAGGVVRTSQEPKGANPAQAVAEPRVPAGEHPFAHPYYWAAFILIGDPE
jgi:CHAT domain-containing protein/tetratricopeptide (TPR) repeat protein